MNFPELPRQIVRREDEPDYQKELWQPTWKCFCCHDTGTVQPHLVAMVINGYSWFTDKIPVCQNPSCCAPSPGEAIEPILDYRLTAVICQQLDAIERQDWRETIKERQINIKTIAQKMSLRQRDRSAFEQEEALHNHQKEAAR